MMKRNTPKTTNYMVMLAMIIFVININFLFFEPRTYNFFWVYLFLIPRITPIISAILLLTLKNKFRFFWTSLLLFIQFIIEFLYFQPWNIPDFESLYFLLQCIVFPVWFFGSLLFLLLTINPKRFIPLKPYLVIIAILLNLILFTLESINFIDFVNNGLSTVLEAFHTIFFNVLPLTILRTGLYIPTAMVMNKQ